MLKAERVNQIIEILEEKGSVNVKQLSMQFGVTMMTIRRDLQEIETRNCINRIHGGAIYQVDDEKITEIPSLSRMNMFKNEKIRIAKKAAEMIGKDETIFLGSGSTTLFLAKEITNREDIKVVTNSIMIVNELATNSKIDLIIVGGFLRRSEFSLLGHFATEMINDIHVDKVMIGMTGIHPRFGLTATHAQELMTDRMIIGMSSNVIVLADHTKIGHVAAIRTEHINAARTIITSKKASHEIVDAITKAGVEVVLV